MKPILFLVAALFCVASPAAYALLVDEEVTPEYVRRHPKEFSVTVAKDSSGLIGFTVVFKMVEPQHQSVTATLVVKSGERTLAVSEVGQFTKYPENGFRFGVAPECLGNSVFGLCVTSYSEREGKPEAWPGGTQYWFRLSDFASPELVKSLNIK